MFKLINLLIINYSSHINSLSLAIYSRLPSWANFLSSSILPKQLQPINIYGSSLEPVSPCSPFHTSFHPSSSTCMLISRQGIEWRSKMCLAARERGEIERPKRVTWSGRRNCCTWEDKVESQWKSRGFREEWGWLAREKATDQRGYNPLAESFFCESLIKLLQNIILTIISSLTLYLNSKCQDRDKSCFSRPLLTLQSLICLISPPPILTPDNQL